MGNFWNNIFGPENKDSDSYSYGDHLSAINRYVARIGEIQLEISDLHPGNWTSLRGEGQ